MFGEYVLFGVAGSALSWRLLPAQLAQIERFYHVRNAEMLSEAQMIAAMQQLKIEQQLLNEEEQLRMQELDMAEMQASQAQNAMAKAPIPFRSYAERRRIKILPELWSAVKSWGQIL